MGWIKPCKAITAATLIGVLLVAYGLQAQAQLVANKSRPLTSKEKHSAIDYAGVRLSNVMDVRGTVATFYASGYQRIMAQVVLKNVSYTKNLCIAPAIDLTAFRKTGDVGLDWKKAPSYGHHFQKGLSFLVWKDYEQKHCVQPPDDPVNLFSPIPAHVLKRLISNKKKIRHLALPTLRARTKGETTKLQASVVSKGQLTSINSGFNRPYGFVYILSYVANHAVLTVHLMPNPEKLKVLSATIAIP